MGILPSGWAIKGLTIAINALNGKFERTFIVVNHLGQKLLQVEFEIEERELTKDLDISLFTKRFTKVTALDSGSQEENLYNFLAVFRKGRYEILMFPKRLV